VLHQEAERRDKKMGYASLILTNSNLSVFPLLKTAASAVSSPMNSRMAIRVFSPVRLGVVVTVVVVVTVDVSVTVVVTVGTVIVAVMLVGIVVVITVVIVPLTTVV